MLSVQLASILLVLPVPNQTFCPEQIMDINSKVLKIYRKSKDRSKTATVENIFLCGLNSYKTK